MPGDLPQFWASFNNAPRRIQSGGWARQVTQADFAISETISGINMRLAAGGIRELHWHLAAEWAYMTYGKCRVTVLDDKGRAYVADVKEGDLWYFPAGFPHSLQGGSVRRVANSSFASTTAKPASSTRLW
jgi:oxalate decarboxylase